MVKAASWQDAHRAPQGWPERTSASRTVACAIRPPLQGRPQAIERDDIELPAAAANESRAWSRALSMPSQLPTRHDAEARVCCDVSNTAYATGSAALAMRRHAAARAQRHARAARLSGCAGGAPPCRAHGRYVISRRVTNGRC